MNWVETRQFKISDRNGRHYVFRRNNAGNTEINIPKTITTKAEAVRWLKAHPDKVAKPNKHKGKRPRARATYHPAFNPFKPNLENRRQSPEYFFKYSSPNYAGASSPARSGTPRTNLTVANFKKSLKNLTSIGSGRQGRAYIASQGRARFVIKVAPYDTLAKQRKEPQPGDTEYMIHAACQKAAPEGVVKIYSHIHALDFVPVQNLRNIKNLDQPHFDLKKQNVIVMELCDGGSLDKWLNTHKSSDELMRRIISQVLKTLRKIGEKYPDFRHNDLHLENIFVSRKRGFLIADFGWARLENKGTNPAVNTANGTKTASYYGVGPKTSSRYDMHLFLNHIRDVCLRTATAVPETMKFLNAVLSPGYRGQTDVHVNDFRLKYEDPCPGLPSLTKVLSHPYLKSKLVSSPMLHKARAKLRRVGVKKLVRPTSANLQRAKARLRKVEPKKTTGGYTNAQLIALTRNQVFKLSPKTRARAVKIRVGLKQNVKKAAVNATARVKAQAVMVAAKSVTKLPKNIMNDPRFVKMWLGIHKNLKPQAGETVYNVEVRARNMARNALVKRLNQGKKLFSVNPSPKKKAKTPSPPPRARILNYKLSPTSRRIKIKVANTGRYVYANGSSVSLEYLKSLASRLQIPIKGLRSKANIAKRIFSVYPK